MISEKVTVVRCDSLAKIRMYNNSIVEVRCVGYFKMYRWWFLITEDVEESGCYVITEASTGCNIIPNYCYEDIEELVRVGKQVIENRRFYFSTKTLNLLVEVGQNLESYNVSNLPINLLML